MRDLRKYICISQHESRSFKRKLTSEWWSKIRFCFRAELFLSTYRRVCWAIILFYAFLHPLKTVLRRIEEILKSIEKCSFFTHNDQTTIVLLYLFPVCNVKIHGQLNSECTGRLGIVRCSTTPIFFNQLQQLNNYQTIVDCRKLPRKTGPFDP